MGFIPSFEEGCRAELNKVTLPYNLGATGEVRHLFQQAFDLPALRHV
jgi:hypothetical protein